jgi:hypothetical protein
VCKMYCTFNMVSPPRYVKHLSGNFLHFGDTWRVHDHMLGLDYSHLESFVCGMLDYWRLLDAFRHGPEAARW